MRRALVVDDEELLRDLMREALGAAGWHVEVARDATEAQRLMRTGPFAVALIDLHLDDQSGVDLCRLLLAASRTPPAIVFVSGDPDLVGVAGEHGFLAKPFGPRELLDAVERRLEAGPP